MAGVAGSSLNERQGEWTGTRRESAVCFEMKMMGVVGRFACVCLPVYHNNLTVINQLAAPFSLSGAKLIELAWIESNSSGQPVGLSQ